MNAAQPIVYMLDASVAITGAFVAARTMARALAGTARVVLLLPKGTTIATSELTDFWRIEYVPMVTPSKQLSACLRYVPILCIGAWRMRTWMHRDDARHLLLNDFYLMHGAVLRILGFRGHIVQWVRCDPSRFAGFLARTMLAIVYYSTNRMVAVSAFVRALLPSAYDANMMYDGYEGQVRAPKEWSSMDKKIFVYIGNYIRGKGQDMALSAFISAAEKDATIHLHFYGGDMGLQKNRVYRAQLEATANASSVAGRVVFHEATNNSFSVLETAYAALNFSHSESFSMTVLEASGAGVPVIATASGGPQEILVEGATGYIIPLHDVDAATVRILALASAPSTAASIGQTAANHIQHHFSFQRFRTELAAFLLGA